MNAAEVFSGDSELARLARELDWSATPLGPPAGWSASLKGAVRLLLNSRYPMFVWWGPSFIQVYNDAYAPMLGQRHPQALGRPAPEVWSDVWSVVGPQAESVLRDGQSTWNDRVLLVMQRKGYTEEAYFTFSYSPAYDDDGGVGGLFCAVSEETDRVIGERRLHSLRRLSAVLLEARTSEQACERLAAALSESSLDLPFALIYLPYGNGSLRLMAATGVETGAPWAPQAVQPSEDGNWPFAAAAQSRRPVIVNGLRSARRRSMQGPGRSRSTRRSWCRSSPPARPKPTASWCWASAPGSGWTRNMKPMRRSWGSRSPGRWPTPAPSNSSSGAPRHSTSWTGPRPPSSPT
jgi:hypothetical protein